MNDTLHALWRYPIKSMLGEQLPQVTVGQKGFYGDRVYALQDVATGNVVSAKNPRKWGKLFQLRAAVAPSATGNNPAVQITLPTGKTIITTQPNGDALLSDFLGREVTLLLTAPPAARKEIYWADVAGLAYQNIVTEAPLGAPPNTFFDFGALHILTTNTLRHLQHLSPAGQFTPARFRPNLLLDIPSAGDGFIENEWVGRILHIGEQVRLQVIIPTPRCVVTTLPQGDLPHDVGILKTALAHNFLEIGTHGTFACVGCYAEVLRGGTIRRGDSVRVE